MRTLRIRRITCFIYLSIFDIVARRAMFPLVHVKNKCLADLFVSVFSSDVAFRFNSSVQSSFYVYTLLFSNTIYLFFDFLL